MTLPVLCPVCFHEETMRARRNGGEPCHDDPVLMRWQPPLKRAGGQVVTPYDFGWWLCDMCGIRLAPEQAATLIDAVLYCNDPNCDSRDEEGFYADSIRAAKGGPL